MLAQLSSDKPVREISAIAIELRERLRPVTRSQDCR